MPPSQGSAAAIIKTSDPAALKLSFPNSDAITKPGIYISRSVAATTPSLHLKSDIVAQSPTAKFLVVCIDINPPFPSFPFLGPALHWIQTDLVASGPADAEGYVELKAEGDVPPVARYAGPGPPPGSAPHDYAFGVWVQPQGCTAEGVRAILGVSGGKELGIRGRMRGDEAKFEKNVGLGEPPVAGNWFKSN